MTLGNNDDAMMSDKFIYTMRQKSAAARLFRREMFKETKTCVIFVDFDLATVIYRFVLNK